MPDSGRKHPHIFPVERTKNVAECCDTKDAKQGSNDPARVGGISGDHVCRIQGKKTKGCG